MPQSVTLADAFDVSAGLTFNDAAGIVAGADDPATVDGGLPPSTIYLRTSPVSLYQKQADGSWIAFGTSSVPPELMDLLAELGGIGFVGGDLYDKSTGHGTSSYLIEWHAKDVEYGDIVPVAYKKDGDAGVVLPHQSYLDTIAIDADIKAAGTVDICVGGVVLHTCTVQSSTVTSAIGVSVDAGSKVQLVASGGIKLRSLHAAVAVRKVVV